MTSEELESFRVSPKDLSLLQKINLRLGGNAYVGHETREGWSGDIPFFVFRCQDHGLVKDYPHGFDERLSCPICAKDVFRNSNQKENENV